MAAGNDPKVDSDGGARVDQTASVLPVTAHTLRLFIHVLAATLWVGGQLTLAGLLPAAREIGEEAPRRLARQFDRLAWPAFGILVITGIWNIAEIDVGSTSTAYQVTLLVKLLLVAVTGGAAAVHRLSVTTGLRAATATAAGLGAVGALFFGILLHG